MGATPTLPPRAWGETDLQPLTPARLASLPVDVRPAWVAYLAESARLDRNLPVRKEDSQQPDASPIPAHYSDGIPRRPRADWITSHTAGELADRVVAWQAPTGGWSKKNHYSRLPSAADLADRSVWSDGTFDNLATITELHFLAAIITAQPRAPGRPAWQTSFSRGVAYVFAAQYPNGGFPQVYPLAGDYHDAITLNDQAFERVLRFLFEIATRQGSFAFVDDATAREATYRFRRALACIIAAQIRGADGKLTIWAQQHDALTLTPAAARDFEPAGLCTVESAQLLEFLITLPAPPPAVVTAIHAAARWFEKYALRDTALRRVDGMSEPQPSAGAPLLWARLYEPSTMRPIFGSRDRVVHYDVHEVPRERRLGYAWYSTYPSRFLNAYASWATANPEQSAP